MASVLTTIADAVVSELNASARTWSQCVAAKRMNVPKVDRDKLKDLSVIVTPKSRVANPLTRVKDDETYEIWIGLQKELTSDDNAESDPLITLGEEIADYFAFGLQLATYTGATVIGKAFGADSESQWMSVKDQEGLLLYTGIILLTFRVVR